MKSICESVVGEPGPAPLHLVELDQRVAHREPLGGQERRRHGPADQQQVAAVEEGVDHADLVAHLRPAEEGHERPVGPLQQPAEGLHLVEQQPAGGPGDEPGRADDRGVGPVGGSEGVVDVAVGQPGQGGGEVHRHLVIGALGLPRLEPQVLQHHHRARGQPGGHGRRLLPDDLRGQGQLGGQHVAEPGGHRRQRVLRVGFALGPAEVGAGDDRRPLAQQPVDGGQRGPDAQVVVDHAPRHRDVEVGPYEDAGSRPKGQVLQPGQVPGSHPLRR